jgi:hypothetical protein
MTGIAQVVTHALDSRIAIVKVRSSVIVLRAVSAGLRSREVG